MSFYDGVILDLLVKERIEDFYREAHAERLVQEALALQPRRSMRSRVAEALHALAVRVESSTCSPVLTSAEA